MNSVKQAIPALFVFTLLLPLTLFISPSFAQTPSINVGPAVGEKAPILRVIDKNNISVSIDDLMAPKGLIVLFFRSADWCPFCKRHLIELNEYADKFKALGYGIAAISYDSSEVLHKFSQMHNLTFPLLSDQGAATVKGYGILNVQYQVGDENYGIPYPGVVVITADGNIDHKYFFEGYRKRVKFYDLYQQLNSIK
ncbi:MAG: peroxiredoxin family protein [Colwellia sp.]|nr:peroxiredoxin family protein [Colwellia sp.]